jgi:putative membrane protein
MKPAGMFVLVSALAVFGVMAFAGQGKATGQDKAFILEAASGGMFEVEAGKLAAEHGSSEDVKNFGKRMVDDHSKANSELMQLAGAKGVEVPKELNKQQRDNLDMLAKKNGKEFDQAYMSLMVKDHAKDVADFRKESTAGKDVEVKGWAVRTLPVLEMHHKMALEITSKK